jgi:hypothetical protein
MGLKPNHFYNVRVIAVGANNFQAGSRVIRLRTFGSDGRPELGDSRVPSNFQADEPTAQTGSADPVEENGTPRRSTLSLETTGAADAQSSARDTSSAAANAASRRNTVTRRHSPSTTSLDQPPIREDSIGDEGEISVQELTLRFDEVRKEINENQAALAREEEESKRQHDELEAEKQERKREQKQKEEQTEKLKREQGATDRSMRSAQQRRTNREKQLREKKNERVKAEESIVRWNKGVDDMKQEQENYRTSRLRLEQERREKLETKQNERQRLKEECASMEVELKERRDSVKELNEARKKLAGEEEEAEWHEQETQLKREWQHRQRDYQQRLDEENRISRKKDAQIHNLTQHMQVITQSAAEMQNQSNASGYDYMPGQFKRRSRHNTSVSSVVPSPLPGFAALDPVSQPPTLGFAGSRLSGSGFAQAPFMDFGHLAPRDEASIRAQSVPLSPSAAALVPKGVLDDDDPPSLAGPLPPLDTLGPLPTIGGPEDDPQSPASSGRSLSIISSPHGSSHNLPFPPFNVDTSDRLSIHAGNDSAVPSSTSRLSNLFSTRRLRGAKGADDGGPALGSLKTGQSQSFPRHMDEQEALANKRKLSLSSTLNVFNRNSAGPGTLESIAPVSGSRLFSRSGFHPFSTNRVQERDPSSPRPDSMASSEHIPRPSTDSGSIWGAPDSSIASRQPWLDKVPWSRNASRRPSIHGSPSALKTTLADAEDEILDQEDLSNPSQVGVIGSRPKTLAQRLNPAATPFLGNVFRSKTDKEKDKDKENVKEKDKGKGKEKDKSKDKAKDKENKKTAAEADGQLRPSMDDSPADSRKSRDALSVHTQTSISISESHDSLSLDQSVSNTPSEPANSPALGSSAGTTGVKEQENVVRKLFRKGSSSKFGLPARLGGKDGVGGGLFKKGPSSIASASANSDRVIPHSDSGPRSSIGDAIDDSSTADETPATTGLGLSRTTDSVTSSPALGPTLGSGSLKGPGGKDGAGGSVRSGTSRWFSIKKKGKADREKDSLEMDRERSEMDGLTPTEETSRVV